MKAIPHLSSSELPNILVFLCLTGLLIAAPAIGKNNGNLLLMQAIALPLITYVLLTKHLSDHVSPAITIFIFTVISLLTLYLIPLPIDLWLRLPGRPLYQDSVSLLTEIGQPMTYHSLSVVPYMTVKALLALLPTLGVFLITITFPPRQITWLVWVFLGVVAWQAAWGLTQAATGIPAHGAYQSYDHFVALMEIGLPLCMAMIAYYFSSHHGIDKRRFLLGLLLVLGLLILVSGLLSRSRGGIFSLFVGLALVMLILYQQMKAYSIGLLGLIALLVISFNSVTSLIPMLNRFLASSVDEDARWKIFTDTITGGKTFFPLGSGPGTFSETFPAFQQLDTAGSGFTKFAHNDYLQLFFETGLVGIGIIIVFLLLYLYGWFDFFQLSQQHHKRESKQIYLLKAGAGAALLASLLHALVDFNFHTLPHPLYFALMAGIFFRKIDDTDRSSVR